MSSSPTNLPPEFFRYISENYDKFWNSKTPQERKHLEKTYKFPLSLEFGIIVQFLTYDIEIPLYEFDWKCLYTNRVLRMSMFRRNGIWNYVFRETKTPRFISKIESVSNRLKNPRGKDYDEEYEKYIKEKMKQNNKLLDDEMKSIISTNNDDVDSETESLPFQQEPIIRSNSNSTSDSNSVGKRKNIIIPKLKPKTS